MHPDSPPPQEQTYLSCLCFYIVLSPYHSPLPHFSWLTILHIVVYISLHSQSWEFICTLVHCIPFTSPCKIRPCHMYSFFPLQSCVIVPHSTYIWHCVCVHSYFYYLSPYCSPWPPCSFCGGRDFMCSLLSLQLSICLARNVDNSLVPYRKL